MNEVEIVEWWHYKIQADFMDFTEDLYLIKLRKIKVWFFKKKEVEWIVYSHISLKDKQCEQVMELEKFKKWVLYKV